MDTTPNSSHSRLKPNTNCRVFFFFFFFFFCFFSLRFPLHRTLSGLSSFEVDGNGKFCRHRLDKVRVMVWCTTPPLSSRQFFQNICVTCWAQTGSFQNYYSVCVCVSVHSVNVYVSNQQFWKDAPCDVRSWPVLLLLRSCPVVHSLVARFDCPCTEKEICSISSWSRVLAHRPCPKLEMFRPLVLQLFYGCSTVLMTNHGVNLRSIVSVSMQALPALSFYKVQPITADLRCSIMRLRTPAQLSNPPERHLPSLMRTQLCVQCFAVLFAWGPARAPNGVPCLHKFLTKSVCVHWAVNLHCQMFVCIELLTCTVGCFFWSKCFLSSFCSLLTRLASLTFLFIIIIIYSAVFFALCCWCVVYHSEIGVLTRFNVIFFLQCLLFGQKKFSFHKFPLSGVDKSSTCCRSSQGCSVVSLNLGTSRTQ